MWTLQPIKFNWNCSSVGKCFYISMKRNPCYTIAWKYTLLPTVWFSSFVQSVQTLSMLVRCAFCLSLYRSYRGETGNTHSVVECANERTNEQTHLISYQFDFDRSRLHGAHWTYAKAMSIVRGGGRRRLRSLPWKRGETEPHLSNWGICIEHRALIITTYCRLCKPKTWIWHVKQMVFQWISNDWWALGLFSVS